MLHFRIGRMENVRAYGAGLAGGNFDINTFVRKPAVVAKIAAGVLGGGLWYCIYKGGWHRELLNVHHSVCLLNGSSTSCFFASAMGFFSLVGAAALLVAEAQFDKISAVQVRRRVVMADVGVSAGFGIIFFLSFFSFWAKYSSFELYEPYNPAWIKTGILFTVLLAVAWGGAAFLAWRRYQEGAVDTFAPTDFQSEFTGIPGDAADGYGYGGNSDGVGSVGNESYQAGGLPQQTQLPAVPPTNPFANQAGYQY